MNEPLEGREPGHGDQAAPERGDASPVLGIPDGPHRLDLVMIERPSPGTERTVYKNPGKAILTCRSWTMRRCKPSIAAERLNEEAGMARVTGIGGVFFKSTSDHKRLAAWYRDNLGLALEDWGGAILKWPEDRAEDRGLTVWHVAERESKWFSPSTSSFMINYRVDDLTALLAQLKRNGVEVVKGPDSAENGKFAWIMDPDGNKVELLEPMIWDEKNKKA
jgi:predicted enzyme related to lactoylglutathione lyase